MRRPGPTTEDKHSATRRRTVRYRRLLAVGTVLLFGGILAGVSIGSTDIPASRALMILLKRALPTDRLSFPEIPIIEDRIVCLVRLPRCILAALVGAMLALAGAQMQGLFRNSLADPGVVGTSQGAALGTVLAVVTGLALRSALYSSLLAFVGAFLSLLLILGFAGGRRVSTGMLLLFGVALNFLLSTLISLILSLSFKRFEVAAQILAFLLGGLEGRSWNHVMIAVPCLAAGLLLSIPFARDLDVMLEGDEAAGSLGVDVQRARRRFLFNTALLTGSAVAMGGVIGFVGLVVPHVVRLWIGPAQSRLFIGSALTGAWFVVLADLAARTLMRPEELQLGIVTACIGAPFFLLLLVRKQREMMTT